MPSDERDRQFERALQRHLREKAPDAACADAETLAAYHERTLSLEEAGRWKEHISGCLRCQETLALVEETDSVEMHEWEEVARAEETELFGAATKSVEKMPNARMRMLNKHAAGMRRAEAPAPAAAKKVMLPSRWKWIGPVGALAAGLLIFVAVRENRMQVATSKTAVQVAENRETGAPNANRTGLPERSQSPKLEQQAADTKNESASAQKGDAGQDLQFSAAAPKQIERERDAVSALSSPVGRVAKDEDAAHTRGEFKPLSPEENRAQEQARADLRTAPAKPGAVAPAPAAVTGFGSGSGIGSSGGAGAIAGDKVQKPPAPNTEKSSAVVAAGATAKKGSSGLSAIAGTVVDPTGAAVTGAVVTAVDTANGRSKTAVADGSGTFRLNDLPSDQYRIIVAQEGFKKSEQMVTLPPQTEEQLSVQLNVGTVSETVEVSSTAQSVQLENSELKKLPVNSRNLTDFAELAAADPHYIITPDQNIVWRVGGSGKIERTADHGKTWRPQMSGVVTELKSGSAPSGNVCWLVGKVGTILLTTDGGRHWKLITSPLKEEVGGVHAVDAMHASIWNVANNKSFETADGGVTWTPAANE